MLKITLVMAVIYLVFILSNFIADYWNVFYNRKCPGCGKRMHCTHLERDAEKKPLSCSFKCKHCGYEETVTWNRLVNETL